MRTLMLHGHATSAFLFKAQTVPLRAKLDKTFIFDFVDGPYSCPPPRGLSSIMPSAYTWMKGSDVDSIRDAVKWLTEYIDKHGPYDNICCFSKAAVVVAAMLMQEARSENKTLSHKMPKSIVFMNGSIEYSFLEELGLPISEAAQKIKFETEELVKSKVDAMSNFATALVRPSAGNGLWDDTSKLFHDPSKLPPSSDCFGLDFSLLPADVFIDIPTVHIVGAKDPIWPSSIQLAYLCKPDKRTFYDHKGGHDLPRTPQVSTDIAGIFKRLAAKEGYVKV